MSPARNAFPLLPVGVPFSGRRATERARAFCIWAP